MLLLWLQVLALCLDWLGAWNFLECLLDLSVWGSPALEQVKPNETLAGHLGELLVQDSSYDGILNTHKILPAFLLIVGVLHPGELVLGENERCLAETIVNTVQGKT